MEFRFAHNNFNVVDLEKSLAFYKKALNLTEQRRKVAEDGSFIIVFLTDGESKHLLELTWLKDFAKPKYDLGDEEFHLAFTVDDIKEALKLHQEMNCVSFVNEKMGIYFITDPDGYWIEIIPQKK